MTEAEREENPRALAAREFRRGVRALRAGETDAAVEALQQVVDVDPDRRRGLVLLGLAHERRGEPELARAAYQEAGATPTGEEREAVAPLGEQSAHVGLPALPERVEALALTHGGLLLAPADRGACVRLRAPLVQAGDVRFEPAGRIHRGEVTGQPIEGDGGPLYRLAGSGLLALSPAGGRFFRVELRGGALFAREDRVEGFDGTLQYESGRVPGRDAHLPLLRLRGRGGVVLHAPRRPFLFAVRAGHRVQVVAECLLGWLGDVLPYLHPGDGVTPPTVICDGDGTLVLVAPAWAVGAVAAGAAAGPAGYEGAEAGGGEAPAPQAAPAPEETILDPLGPLDDGGTSPGGGKAGGGPAGSAGGSAAL